MARAGAVAVNARLELEKLAAVQRRSTLITTVSPYRASGYCIQCPERRTDSLCVPCGVKLVNF